MGKTLDSMVNQVIEPAKNVGKLPLDIAAATLGIDAFRGKNPVKSITDSTGEALRSVFLMPINVAKTGIIGMTKLALGALASAVTGTARAAGKAVLNAPIIPGKR